jgi:hypothetical protein
VNGYELGDLSETLDLAENKKFFEEVVDILGMKMGDVKSKLYDIHIQVLVQSDYSPTH